MDYESINFSAKVRYNYVTETERAREGTETGADEPCYENKVAVEP